MPSGCLLKDTVTSSVLRYRKSYKTWHDMCHDRSMYKWERIIRTQKQWQKIKAPGCIMKDGTLSDFTKEKQHMWSLLHFHTADEIVLEGPEGGRGRAVEDRWGKCAAYSTWSIHKGLHMKKVCLENGKSPFQKEKKLHLASLEGQFATIGLQSATNH